MWTITFPKSNKIQSAFSLPSILQFIRKTCLTPSCNFSANATTCRVEDPEAIKILSNSEKISLTFISVISSALFWFKISLIKLVRSSKEPLLSWFGFELFPASLFFSFFLLEAILTFFKLPNS